MNILTKILPKKAIFIEKCFPIFFQLTLLPGKVGRVEVSESDRAQVSQLDARLVIETEGSIRALKFFFKIIAATRKTQLGYITSIR